MSNLRIDRSVRRPFGERSDALTPLQRRAVIGVIALLHLALAWGLLQIRAVRDAVVAFAPMTVSLVSPSAPPMPPPVQPAEPVPERPTPPKMLVAAKPKPRPTPSPFVAEAPAPPPPVAVVAAPASAAPASPGPVAAASTEPQVIPASAIRFIVPPPVEYPRASRRLRETGRAIVRVLINEAGQPQQVQLKTSTGFPLLDEAALAAVRKARFKPYIEDGKPRSGWAVIPLSFDLEN